MNFFEDKAIEDEILRVPLGKRPRDQQPGGTGLSEQD
jgi:hypothetical protein